MAKMTSAAINDLSDDQFAYIEPGGSKDLSGKTTPRSLRHFPIHDAAHVRNALARAPQSPFGEKAMPKIRAAAKKFGIDMSDDSMNRSDDLLPQTGFVVTRSTPLDDISVRSGRVTCDTCGNDATGRMVDAYAAVFRQGTEIHDDHGDYIEDIDPTAFNRRLDHLSRSRGGLRDVSVFYNHGKTLYGTPMADMQLPLGHPAAIRSDGHGLLTSTHYTTSGERVLQSVKDGDVSGHSFTGRIVRSNPQRVPKVSRSGDLPLVTRLELGLVEYGPTPMPAYSGAQLVGVRSHYFPPQYSEGPTETEPPLQPSGLGAEDSHASALRSAEEIRRQIRRALTIRS